jgi:hypothetical protein
MVVKPTNSILGHLFFLLVKDSLGEIKIRELGQIKFRVSHGNSSLHGIDCLSHCSEHRGRQVLTEVVATVRRKLGSVGLESIIMTVEACRTVEMLMVVIDGRRGLKRISVAERAHRDVSKLLVVIERKQGLSLINRSQTQSGINMTQRAHNTVELLMVIERRRGINVTSITRTGSVRESPEKLLIVVEGIGSLSVINMRGGAAEKSKKRLIVIVDARVWSSHTKGRSGRDGDAQLSGDLFVSLVRVI